MNILFALTVSISAVLFGSKSNFWAFYMGGWATASDKLLEGEMVICVAILLLMGFGIFGCGLHYDEIEILKANWDIDMPQPLKIINVASNVGGLPADGTAYHVLEYNDETITELKKFRYWGNAGTIISNDIAVSLKNLEESEEVPAKNKELMKNYLPKVDDSCLYYYKKKRDFNYVIMMLDVSKKRVYVFEFST